MDPIKRKNILFLSNREKLSQFSQNLDSEVNVGLTNNSLGCNRNNWQHELLCCGSNSSNQLHAELQDLMIPIFKHVVISSNEGKEILQISCNGNQTAVLFGEEKESTYSHLNNEGDQNNKDDLNLINKKFNYQLYLWGSGKSSSQMSLPINLPLKCTIKKLACGHTHAGFTTEAGAVFTWGSGDYGMLGHGTKNSINSPKRVESMKSLVCSSISCGAFHTAFIAFSKDKTMYIRIPEAPIKSFSGIGYAGASIASEEQYGSAGDLYCCGLGKGGQLGLSIQLGQLPHSGSNAGIALRPILVPYFEEIGHKVIKVSCGFHHTLVITVPAQSHRIFSPTIYAFGYGEHGRLGIGSEEQITTPIQVLFTTPFHPTNISAGEQHSLAIGKEGCYSWGSNDHGQLGIGSPKDIPFSVLPQKIQIPEGMIMKKIVAGGRHTAGITYCGNVLCWGWGEEGQLGHNTEKSSNIPKPCKLPFIYNNAGSPVDLSLGSTHTYIVMHNQNYIPPIKPTPQVTEETEIIEEYHEINNITIPVEGTVETIDNNEEIVIPIVEEVIEEEKNEVVLEHSFVSNHKPPSIIEDEIDYDTSIQYCLPKTPTPTTTTIRSIKDILNQREERKANAIALEMQVDIEPPIIYIEEKIDIVKNKEILISENPAPIIAPETIPHIAVIKVPTTITEEYTFDAIPFQHSRKRSEITKLRKSTSMTK